LLLLIPFIPVQGVAILSGSSWKVSLAAALLLSVCLAALSLRNPDLANSFAVFTRTELKFLILPCALFILWSAASCFWAESWKYSAYHTALWCSYLAFYFLIRQTVEQRSFFYATVYALGAVVWIIAAPCVIEYFLVTNKEVRTDIGIRYSKFAEAFNILLPLFLAFSLKLRKKQFRLCSATVLIGWLLIISSLGRTALAVCLFSTLMLATACFLTKQSSQIRKRIAAFLLILIALILATQLLPKENITVVERATSGEANESFSVRPMLAFVALEMFKDNWLTGVGADNFGLRYTEYRAKFGEQNPQLATQFDVEDVLPERAHNEYLQVFSELGIIGGVFFCFFLLGIGRLFWTAFRNRRKISPASIGALTGITAFLLSSLVTSYSFRVTQNGLVFFFVLAIASKSLFGRANAEKSEQRFVFSPQMNRVFAAAGIAACLSLFALSTVRALGFFYLAEANRTESLESAAQLYRSTTDFDSDNPAAFYFQGVRFLNNNRAAEAVPLLQTAIERGMTTSINYSYLATAQTLAGDVLAAEKTMSEAVKIYPRSTFARMRYAALLEQNGKNDLSAEQRRIALQFNAGQAQGWWNLITKGGYRAVFLARADENITPPAALKPETAIFAVLNERELVYPEERSQFAPKN
jgi:O-antigen ligase